MNKKLMCNTCILPVLIIVLSCNCLFAGSELITFHPRPNVKLKVLVIEPEKPDTVLVLYAGGLGKLDLSSTFGIITIGNKWYKDDFMVRVREKFVERGFAVALPDSPSDHPDGIGARQRTSEVHSREIQDFVSYLKKRYNLPVWIAGISAGSFTVANAGITQEGQINGVIFSSSIVKSDPKWKVEKCPDGVMNMELSSIKIPVFIAAHKEDGCEWTPPDGAELIRKALTSAPKVEVKYYSGGSRPISEPCFALSQHGFYGIEDQVIADIVAFIRSN
jgi:dienelactone hydrolase